MHSPIPPSDDAPDAAMRQLFLAVVEECYEHAIAAAHAILKDRSLAEDAVVETAAKCWKKWWQCKDPTTQGFKIWFGGSVRKTCLMMLRDSGRGKIVPFDEQMLSPEWEAQNAACFPADQIANGEEAEEMQRVLGLLVTLLRDNYRGAILERLEDGQASTFQHSDVVFWRAKKKLIKLRIAYQNAADALAECPNRLLLDRLSVVSLMKLRMWLVGSGPPPPADAPGHLIASDAKWEAFRKCLRAIEADHRIAILNDLIPAFRAIKR